MSGPRPISAPLMLGLIAVPVIFVWFLFGRGYAPSTRNAALAYAFGPAILSLLVTGLDAVFRAA